jgi:hypothetical protein
LITIGVDGIGKISDNNPITLNVIFVNRTLYDITISKFVILEILYQENAPFANIHGIDRIRYAPKISPFLFSPPFAFPIENHIQAGKDGAVSVFQIYYSPTSVLMNGVKDPSPVLLPSGHTSGVKLTFSPFMTPPIVEQGKSNAVAAALIIDIVTNKGNIDRRVCPAFESVKIEDVFSSTGVGALGINPHILLPHGPGFLCESAKEN